MLLALPDGASEVAAGSLLRVTRLGWRFAALGLSGALHAALLLAPLGGDRGVTGAAPSARSVDVTVEPEPAPAPAPTPRAPLENRTAEHPTRAPPYTAPPDHNGRPHDPSPPHPREEIPPKVDARAVLSAEEEVPRFVMVISSGASTAAGVATGASRPEPTGANRDDDSLAAALPEMAVDTRAQLVRGKAPDYPSAARADGVEAAVLLELVVSASGAVEEARVVQSSGHGLDEAAVAAARQFRFSPAQRRGKPVRVRMSWKVEFRLD
jgi:protein TonB